jgi:transposase
LDHRLDTEFLRVAPGSGVPDPGHHLHHLRAGLFPSRYQSDEVDRADGPLVRRANHALRAAILGIADNLILCNHYFNAMAAKWRAAGKDPRLSHVKIGMRFCRIASHMVAGRQVFHHPCLRERNYILDKLLAFHS